MFGWPESSKSDENMAIAMAMYNPAESDMWIAEYESLEDAALREEGRLPTRKVEPRRKLNKIEIVCRIIGVGSVVGAFGWVILSTLFD